jgi:hypothetical protein
MAGYGHDTESLALTVALDDGTTVQVTGENDGVNGFEWSAMHVLAHGTVPVPVEVHREVLIDGITPAEELA